MPVSRRKSHSIPPVVQGLPNSTQALLNNTAPETPLHLRTYEFHGVHLTIKGTQATGECPFCGKEGHFSVHVETGLWRCLICGTGTTSGGGNALIFIRLLYEKYKNLASEHAKLAWQSLASSGPVNASGNGTGDYPNFATERGLVDPRTIAAYGMVPDGRAGWIIPGYGVDGTLDQLYRRIRILENNEWVWLLLPTPGLWLDTKAHALHLPVEDFDPSRPRVDVFEGPWDAMAVWEVTRDNPDWADTNIIAVPGCNVWRDEWTEFCQGKHVTLWFDSDHPRAVGDKVFRAGYDGMKRVASRLAGTAASIRWLKWGVEGYDPLNKSGWDVRDVLISAGNTIEARMAVLSGLTTKIEDVPKEWEISSNGRGSIGGSTGALQCQTWVECETAWKDAILLRQDLKDAIAVILAVCASTNQGGNQLFLDLIGSPGSAKTTICQGLLVSNHCVHLENVTKLITGWKKPEDGEKDCSFLARSNNKTWVTCEFDVVGSSPEYHQLMGKVRRIFDGETSTTYGNDDKDRIYTALRTPWIRAGTHKMMDRMADRDQSQLGDRFLRFIIGEPGNDERRDIARSAMHSERSAMLERTNCTAGSMVDRKTRRAQALTGGYVDWLRANVEEKLASLEIPPYAEDYFIDLAELCADLRARPNESRRAVDTHDGKELPTRLARQNIRMASCLAVVLNKFTVDSEVLRIVRKVALDTAHGHSLNIVQWLCSPNPRVQAIEPGKTYQECGGLMEGTLSSWTNMTPERLLNYLMFLRKIQVLKWAKTTQSRGFWSLTDRVYNLYLNIMRS